MKRTPSVVPGLAVLMILQLAPRAGACTRHKIAHNWMLTREDIPRIARLKDAKPRRPASLTEARRPPVRSIKPRGPALFARRPDPEFVGGRCLNLDFDTSCRPHGLHRVSPATACAASQ